MILSNEDECYEFKLVGVNIHMGTADAGHYYSLINTDRFQKDENSEDWGHTEKDKWMEFNDANVTPYNFDELKDDCFGGTKENDDGFASFFKSGGFGKNGYVLVYEKRKKKPIKLLVNDDTEESPECTDTAHSRVNSVVNYKYYGGVERQVYHDKARNEKFVLIPMNEI